jgi:hypothetical protein
MLHPLRAYYQVAVERTWLPLLVEQQQCRRLVYLYFQRNRGVTTRQGFRIVPVRL